MKKKIFLVSALIAMAMGVMFVGCKDKNAADDTSDSKDIEGCKCTYYVDGEKESSKIDIEDMEDYYDVSTCSKLAKYLEKEFDLEDVSCKEY